MQYILAGDPLALIVSTLSSPCSSSHPNDGSVNQSRALEKRVVDILFSHEARVCLVHSFLSSFMSNLTV